jgi:hypothetical protein
MVYCRDFTELSSEPNESNSHSHTIIAFLDITHRPILFKTHNVWETGFCIRLQVEPTQLDQIDDRILSPKRCVF